MELNPNLAGLADHKFKIGDLLVWADSEEKAVSYYRQQVLGVFWRCDPKVLAAAEKRMNRVPVPPVNQLY